MKGKKSKKGELFDNWVHRYDMWFKTPVGTLVKKYETELLVEMLQPQQEEFILDVGCGSGIFTLDILGFGTKIIGLDISYPMLIEAEKKTAKHAFRGTVGNMISLPFADNIFDKAFSMTALEFVADAQLAIKELHRVVRPGGIVVLTTLNSLSPWAERRIKEAAKGHDLFNSIIFRSPSDLAQLAPGDPEVKTAIHFLKGDDPETIPSLEEEGKLQNKNSGAFVAMAWRKGVELQES